MGGAYAARLSGDLLRRHVGRRADEIVAFAALAGLLSEAEVAHQGAVVVVQEDVAGLEVAVNDAVAVGVMDGPGHRLHPLYDGRR